VGWPFTSVTGKMRKLLRLLKKEAKDGGEGNVDDFSISSIWRSRRGKKRAGHDTLTTTKSGSRKSSVGRRHEIEDMSKVGERPKRKNKGPEEVGAGRLRSEFREREIRKEKVERKN